MVLYLFMLLSVRVFGNGKKETCSFVLVQQDARERQDFLFFTLQLSITYLPEKLLPAN